MNSHLSASTSQLYQACVNGDVKLAQQALKKGARVNYQHPNGWCALLIACQYGHAKCVEFLLNKGANVEIQNQEEFSALMLACTYGHSKCVELLLNKGANVEIQNQDGVNALMKACHNGHSRCVELLLNKGASVDIQDHCGWNALMYACQNGRSRCVELLLNKGANVEIQNQDGVNALMKACQNGRSRCVELLLNKGANVEIQNQEGVNSLIFACAHGHSECVEFLLNKGANVEIQIQEESNALMLACQNGHLKCVELLLKYGADANVQNPNTGATALTLACMNGHEACVELLLQHGGRAKDGLRKMKVSDFSGNHDDQQQHVHGAKSLLDVRVVVTPEVQQPSLSSVYSPAYSSAYSSSCWSKLQPAPTWIRLVSTMLCLGSGPAVFASLVEKAFVELGICYDVDENQKEIYGACFAGPRERESTFVVRLYEYTRNIGAMLAKTAPGAELPKENSGPVVVVEFTRSSGCAFAFSRSFSRIVQCMGSDVCVLPKVMPAPQQQQFNPKESSEKPTTQSGRTLSPTSLRRSQQQSVFVLPEASLGNLVAMASSPEKGCAERSLRMLAQLVSEEENAQTMRLKLMQAKEDGKSCDGESTCLQMVVDGLSNENDPQAARLTCDVVCALLAGARACCTWTAVEQLVGPMLALLEREASSELKKEDTNKTSGCEFFAHMSRSRMIFKLLQALDSVTLDFETEFMDATEHVEASKVALRQIQQCPSLCAENGVSSTLIQTLLDRMMVTTT